ncbi:MAG TPA: helix-hairpin-helix domain-containing protein [Ktedonobacterales bacterium]|nr:helix-hairpin-helix domain-containing protein [Ktedonobacterales bacterium]
MFQFTQSVQLMADPGERVEDLLPARVGNQKVAEILFNIATILEMQQANPYRIVAYRNAARGILALGEPIAPILARGELPPVPGLGERLRRKITELVMTGRMTFYDDLCEESLPEDVRELMRVPHVGPRTALKLAAQLDIHSVPELWEAAERRRLREHFGFGPRSERRLAEGARSVLDTLTPAA